MPQISLLHYQTTPQQLATFESFRSWFDPKSLHVAFTINLNHSAFFDFEISLISLTTRKKTVGFFGTLDFTWFRTVFHPRSRVD